MVIATSSMSYSMASVFHELSCLIKKCLILFFNLIHSQKGIYVYMLRHILVSNTLVLHNVIAICMFCVITLCAWIFIWIQIERCQWSKGKIILFDSIYIYIKTRIKYNWYIYCQELFHVIDALEIEIVWTKWNIILAVNTKQKIAQQKVLGSIKISGQNQYNL